jgi:hypothetical protein
VLTYVVALILITVCSAQPGAAFPHKLLIIEPTNDNEKEKNSPLQLELQETENGLKVLIRFVEIQDNDVIQLPPEHDGGEYVIFLDEMIVLNNTFTGTSLSVSEDVSLTTLQTGKHVLRCELRSPSGEIHKGEIRFIFDGSPVLNVTDVAVDKVGILDASVMLNILGDDGNGRAGFVQVSLDERLVMNVEVTNEHTGRTTPLSQITGKPISTTSLVPGTHLLTLRAVGINGNAGVSYNSFSVSSIPELQIVMNQTNEFQEAVATFHKVPQGYSGVVDVLYNQNLILSKQEKGASISIKRAEIIEGLKSIQHELLINDPTSLVFALHAANGSENWQKIDFK